MTVYNLPPYETLIDNSAWVAPGAAVIGCVTLGRHASVWFNAVIRGDNERIEVGEDSNVQEGAVLHTDVGYPLRIGRRVSVGHQAMLHGCQVGDGSMIGIQAVVMNGAQIGKNCIVGAGAVVTEGKVFPDNVLIVGCPAKVVRELTGRDAANIDNNATDYVERAQRYKLTLEASG
jgi:carbonic anhydrase/acetyltransferase-like protein (isoleucine patch superfamily)